MVAEIGPPVKNVAGYGPTRFILSPMQAAQLGPVAPHERTQSALDLFLIFAGANIVSTTLQVGAALAGDYTPAASMGLILGGSVMGAALVGALAPLGPRLGVPSVIAARAALGTRGAALVAGLLYLTNFAWIAVNNVIAASVCARALGPAGSERVWAVGLGLLATAIVALGPRAVGRADRVAVPLMLGVGAALTVACLRLPAPPAQPTSTASLVRGLDVVIGYQVSWLLMFADYSRYTASERKSLVAVFLGLALTSAWFMPLGWLAARAAGSSDPGAMLLATGLGIAGAFLIALATLTTNFVNIYLSSLAWKSLLPTTGDQVSVWSIGLVGTALGLFSGAWLDRYSDLMLILGSILVPVGAVLLAHFFVVRPATRVDDLYDMRGPYSRYAGFAPAGALAWIAGAVTYHAAGSIGSTIAAFVVTVAAYVAVSGVMGRGR
jgi:purine-cytosine permease-like protein